VTLKYKEVAKEYESTLLTKLQELKDSIEEEDTIQDLVSRTFKERGSLSNCI
jgi:hypothetical protein